MGRRRFEKFYPKTLYKRENEFPSSESTRLPSYYYLSTCLRHKKHETFGTRTGFEIKIINAISRIVRYRKSGKPCTYDHEEFRRKVSRNGSVGSRSFNSLRVGAARLAKNRLS